jgi:hypothetical protein
MKGDDPEFREATRLIHKFFPEAKDWIPAEVGLDWDAFLGSMQSVDYTADYSCYPFRTPTDPDRGLAEQGGLDGRQSEVYRRLLKQADWNPQGRAVVVPDALGRTGWSLEECPPFVCAAESVPERLDEIEFFHQSRDALIVFESGETLLIDHDNRVHWARSRRR